MALVREFGFPDYFITMTANPAWPEIRENLRPWESAADRPDLVARVFKMKLEELQKDLFERGVLGQMIANTWVIEFQKRGLPHAHILVIVRPADKPRSMDEIDRVVCAELPDEHTQPELWQAVTAHMFHGPCGDAKPDAPCMVEGMCSKNFPREFAECTSRPEDGYPVYRRRENGRGFERNGHWFDNRRVVAYNPYLLQKYRCHLNVEIVNTIKSIKYMYKYTYKGHDRAGLEIKNVDEIVQFLDTRYVGPCEAVWRILEFPMHGRSHAVQRLPVHLDGNQTVMFSPDEVNDADAMQARLEASKQTMLTAYFALNAKKDSAKVADRDLAAKAADVVFPDIPKYFTWDSKARSWKDRKQINKGDRIISRMYAVDFQDSERYWLRAVLLNVPGATSFGDLLAKCEARAAARHLASESSAADEPEPDRSLSLNHPPVHLSGHTAAASVSSSASSGNTANTAAHPGGHTATASASSSASSIYTAHTAFHPSEYTAAASASASASSSNTANTAVQLERQPVPANTSASASSSKATTSTLPAGNVGNTASNKPQDNTTVDPGKKAKQPGIWEVAAKKLGLIADDQEYERALEESLHSSTDPLRFFAYMLRHAEVHEPGKLWSKFGERMAMDSPHTRRLPASDRRAAALRRLKDLVDDLGGIGIEQKSWAMTDLPTPAAETREQIARRMVDRATNVDVEAAAAVRDRQLPQLNPQQREAFDAVMTEVKDSRDGTAPPRARLVYVDGPGGCGKTFLYETLICHLQAEGDIALACALSGIAATLLPGGVTAHKLFGAPPDVTVDTPSRIGAHTGQAALLRAARLILWDEASMSPKGLYGYADKVLQDLTGNAGVPFGGKVVVVGGDWRQILPVVPFGDRAEVIASTLQMHYTWKEGHFRMFPLTKNMRAAGATGTQAAYREWLLAVGDGRVNPNTALTPHSIALPPEITLEKGSDTHTLLQWVYTDLVAQAQNLVLPYTAENKDAKEHADAYFQHRAILTPLNVTVDELNNKLLETLPDESETTSCSLDRAADANEQSAAGNSAYPTELLNSLNPPGAPPHELRVRPGAVVMLTCNLDRGRGLCNGTRGVVTHSTSRLVTIRVLVGRAKGQTVDVPRITQKLEPSKTKLPFTLLRRQFPLRLAWVLTINKAQGQTFRILGVYLPNPVFAHGQLYVAASRVGFSEGIRFLVEQTEKQGYHHDPEVDEERVFTDNIVYRSLLVDSSTKMSGNAVSAAQSNTDGTATTPIAKRRRLVDLLTSTASVNTATAPSPAASTAPADNTDGRHTLIGNRSTRSTASAAPLRISRFQVREKTSATNAVDEEDAARLTADLIDLEADDAVATQLSRSQQLLRAALRAVPGATRRNKEDPKAQSLCEATVDHSFAEDATTTNIANPVDVSSASETSSPRSSCLDSVVRSDPDDESL